MHGKRITLRSAKWRATRQEQHQSLGLVLLHGRSRRHGQREPQLQNGRHGGPALDETLEC